MSGWGRRFVENVSQSLSHLVAEGQQVGERIVDGFSDALDSLQGEQEGEQPVPVRVRTPNKLNNPEHRS